MSATQQQSQASLAMMAAMIMSGFIGLFVTESQMDEVSITFFRCLIGGVGLWAYCHLKGIKTHITLNNIGWIIMAGIALVINWILLFNAFRHIPISIATLIYNLQPFFLLVLSAVLLKEKAKKSTWGWMLIAFAGVYLVAEVKASSVNTDIWLGMLFALGAAIFYAITTMLTRKVKGVPASAMAATQLSFCLIPLGAWLFIQGVDWSQVDWRFVGLLGGINSFGQYILLYFAFAHLAVDRLAILSFLYPITTVLVDMLYFDLALTNLQWAGMALIILANLAILRKKADTGQKTARLKTAKEK